MSRGVLMLILAGVLLGSCNKRFSGIFKDDIVINEFDFEYLTAKAKIKYDDGQHNLSGSANIRVRKDSAIWMSFSPGLGVEVARLLMLEDSVYFLDRINNKYLRADYTEFSKIYDFEIDYHIIQAVIIGNLIYPYRRTELKKEADGTSYQQMHDGYMVSNYIGDNTKKLEHVAVEDVESKNSISVDYSEFRELAEDVVLPYNIKFTLEYLEGDKETTQIDIGLSKANLLTKAPKFPFNVPDKYRSY